MIWLGKHSSALAVGAVWRKAIRAMSAMRAAALATLQVVRSGKHQIRPVIVVVLRLKQWGGLRVVD